jgi:Holliday junction resolvase RusA-like endonuclease
MKRGTTMAKGKIRIKSRKQRAKEYIQQYGAVSDDVWERIKGALGDRLTPEILQDALERVQLIEQRLTYSAVRFTFYEEPVQSHRPRVNFFTKNMHVPNAKENWVAIKELVKDIRESLLVTTPMRAELKAYYPMPATVKPIELILYETEHDYAIGKPDFDNVLKAYLDMMIENVILDDDIVCSCSFDKYFSLKPRVELTIVYPDGYSSEYTYKTLRSRKSYREQTHRITAELLVDTKRRRKKR